MNYTNTNLICWIFALFALTLGSFGCADATKNATKQQSSMPGGKADNMSSSQNAGKSCEQLGLESGCKTCKPGSIDHYDAVCNPYCKQMDKDCWEFEPDARHKLTCTGASEDSKVRSFEIVDRTSNGKVNKDSFKQDDTKDAHLKTSGLFGTGDSAKVFEDACQIDRGASPGNLLMQSNIDMIECDLGDGEAEIALKHETDDVCSSDTGKTEQVHYVKGKVDFGVLSGDHEIRCELKRFTMDRTCSK